MTAASIWKNIRYESGIYENFHSERQTEQTNGSAFVKPVEKVVLLADLELFEFPLECLRVFRENNSINSIVRDFSVHFFATRLNSLRETGWSLPTHYFLMFTSITGF